MNTSVKAINCLKIALHPREFVNLLKEYINSPREASVSKNSCEKKIRRERQVVADEKMFSANF